MMIEKFRRAYEERFQRARQRKAQGQKIAGWLCTYVPEEILQAAGMMPMRVTGGAEATPRGDAYLYTNACSYVRNCMEMAIRGDYDVLDAFVTFNTCDHIRRMFDVWEVYVPTPYKGIFHLPCKVDETAIQALRAELLALRRELEEHFSLAITDDALWEAIRLYNRFRSLLRELYELRLSDKPALSGAEALEVVRACMVMPKEECIPLLEELLEQVKSRGQRHDSSLRLMVMGSELENPQLLELVESLGGLIVIDDLCCGSKYFWDLVEEEGSDPWLALAKRYLKRRQCPRIRPSFPRIDYLKEMAKEYRVDGVIYQIIKFCDLHGGVSVGIREGFKEVGLPILFLEKEYGTIGSGQLRTRVEAFFEKIGGA